MLISDLVESPNAYILFMVVLVAALSWHEAAHALIAKKLGDDTAESLGRLTLNPFAHLDPIGSIAILIFGIGWGKPVPVNPNNFANPKLDNLKVALAGPISNIILALIFAGFNAIFQPDQGSLASNFSQAMVYFNLLLALFNLIPIPPLDGSKLIHLFLSEENALKFEQYGFYLLVGLIAVSYFGIPVIGVIIAEPSQFLFDLLIGGS